MGDTSKQICRLCLKITPLYECHAIEGTEKHMLEVLLINMDFDTSDYPVACKNCMERLQNCFDFKSHAIAVVNVDVKVDNKNLKMDMTTNGNICSEQSQICRLCMSYIENGAFNCVTEWKDGLPLIDVIGIFLPHLDIKAIKEVLICVRCQRSITSYHEFMKSCQEIEQRIQQFCQTKGYGTARKVILKDLLLQFKECHTLDEPIFKKESSDVKNYDNGTKCLKSEEFANIECEDINIKDEVESVGKRNGSEESENSESIGENDSPKTKSIRKYKSQETGHLCPKCPYFTRKRPRVKTGMCSDSDNKTCECSLCPFITAIGLSLKVHMSHRGPTKAFGCCECSYETNIKGNFTRHFLSHKNKFETEHLKCDKCEYETKYKDNLIRHAISHEVSKFQCEKCPYRSKSQYKIKRHMLVHSNAHQYSCDECSFSTNLSASLHLHKLGHLKDGERKIANECKLCGYQTKTKATLRDHMAKAHMDPSVPIIKCLHCPYQTTITHSLLKHARCRHSSEDKQIIKCHSCPYVTWEESDMRSHSFVHREIILKCNLCEYHTKTKAHMKQHQLKHMEPAETTMYYCATCDYQTKYKHSLTPHMPRCLKTKTI